MNLLIKSGRVIDPETNLDSRVDILIEKGKITKIGKIAKIPSGFKIIDADKKIVFPGLIDLHTHLREPGEEEKETIETGTKAAARGGFTGIVAMPNTRPPVDSRSVVEFIRNQAERKGLVNVYVIGSITRERRGETLSEIADLKKAGVVALSDDGSPVLNSELMRRALEYARMFNLPIISHAEDLYLSNGGLMHEGFVSTRLGLAGIPSVAEEIGIARDIMLAEYTGGRLHLAHISTAGSVELVRRAKKKGLKVTAETCPHYFSLTDKAVETFETSSKINPPLRPEKDRQAIIKGLKDGTIDVIATDHAPHTLAEKELDYDSAPFGIVGLETALSLAVSKLLKEEKFSPLALAAKMSLNPAKILGLDKGRVQVGKVADLTIVDLNKEYTVRVEDFASKGKSSPFQGWSLQGKVEVTIVGGKVVYSNTEKVNFLQNENT